MFNKIRYCIVIFFGDRIFSIKGESLQMQEGPLLPAGKLGSRLLGKLLGRYVRHGPGLVVGPGIGIDAAVIDVGSGYLLAKSDPITFATDRIGLYAIHVNANDIAVMGGRPRWFLATVLLPEGRVREADVEAIFAQIAGACQEIDVTLCGGHTEVTAGLARPIVVGAMLGQVERDRLVTAAGARAGDKIILTKGAAIEATSIIAREKGSALQGRVPESMIERCRDFLVDPGISVLRDAAVATAAGEVHAMHDPTEGGVAAALHEIAIASGVGLEVRAESILVRPETRRLCEMVGIDPLGAIASGGLLAAVAPADADGIVVALAVEGIEAAVIGEVRDPSGGVKIVEQGVPRDLPDFAQDEIGRLFAGGDDDE